MIISNAKKRISRTKKMHIRNNQRLELKKIFYLPTPPTPLTSFFFESHQNVIEQRYPRHLRQNFDPHRNFLNLCHPYQNLTLATHKLTHPCYLRHLHYLTDSIKFYETNVFMHGSRVNI